MPSFRHWLVIGPGPASERLSVTVEPASTFWLAGWVTINGVTATRSVAFELAIRPLTSLTVAEYVPASPACTLASINVGVPAPLMLPPFPSATPFLLQE